MMDENQLFDWLLEGDVSIQYQLYRDLLATEKPQLRDRIATEGWGVQFLSKRKKEGHWGNRFYQSKWISTHYTLLDLKNLTISPTNEPIRQSIWQNGRFLAIDNFSLVAGRNAGKQWRPRNGGFQLDVVFG